MTQRLLSIAQSNWVTIDGEAAWRGVDLLSMPFDSFLNVIYHAATRKSDEAGIRKFDIRLWMPPPGVVATHGPWSAEAETSAFKGLKAALGLNGQDRGVASSPEG